MPASRLLIGPHAVHEALRAGTPLHWIALSRDRRDRRLQEIVALARTAGVGVRWEAAAALDRLAGATSHRGVVAQAEVKAVLDLSALLAAAREPALLLALDGIEDPHNLGAIIRSACGAGIDGLILPERRAAGITGTVERVSAGALEHVRLARVGNLVQALETLKGAGVWIAGLDERATTTLWEHDFRLPTAMVIGAEGRGLHALTRRRCDFLVSIPMAAGVPSLNASVAAALVLFEAVRQRRR